MVLKLALGVSFLTGMKPIDSVLISMIDSKTGRGVLKTLYLFSLETTLHEFQ